MPNQPDSPDNLDNSKPENSKPENSKPENSKPENLKRDSALAALLHKAEPPQSPAHLDDAILRYARENAPAKKGSGMLGDWSWLQRNWVPAVATFSIAMIGISISLQLFTDPELARTPTGIAVQDFAQDSALSPARSAELSSAQPSVLSSDPPSAAVSAQTSAQASAQLSTSQPSAPIAEQADALSNLIDQLQQERERLEFAENSIVILSPDAVVEADVELDLADLTANNSQAMRRSAAGQAATAAPAQPNLAVLVAADASLQDTVIITLRRALGMREQTAVQRRGRFPDEIRPYLETYRDLRDATILANVQTRYEVARAELLDARLPQTIAELVSILETL